ncbi:MAG: insulinase family protein [Bacteroidota bacterium]
MQRNYLFLLTLLGCASAKKIPPYVQKKAPPPPFDRVEDLNTLKIKTPSLKKRKTAKIKLANGLQVLLISDPKAGKSAASLSMKVGSWDDPDKYPGMAHFCEHLLFMGTKTYPKEYEFKEKVYDSHGIYNATTYSRNTTYTFTTNASSFPDLLERFACFFKEPLFAQSSVERELHAIDQENDLYKKNAQVRMAMVFKEMCDPAHPHIKFVVGNAKTLRKIPLEELRKWFSAKYSADKACLVLYGKHAIEELTTLAVRHFSGMPNHSTPSTSYPAMISSDQQRGHITYVKPITTRKSLTLLWELPEAYDRGKNNHVPHLVAEAINHKGENSLFTQLNLKNLAGEVSAGILYAEERAFFGIEVSFGTDATVLDIDTIVQLCLQNIALIKAEGIPPYLFEERQKMAKITYEYQSLPNPFAFVKRCSQGLHYEPLATYPLKSTLYTPFNAEEVKTFARLLTVEDAILTVAAPCKLTGVQFEKKEKWYQVPYTVKKVSEEQLKAWKNLPKNPNIGFPSPNPFIPKDISLVSIPQENPPSPKPLLLEKGEKGTVYYYQDDRYGSPMIMSKFTFKSPLIDGSPQQSVLLTLFVTWANKIISFIPFQKAGCSVQLYEGNLALSLVVHGYRGHINAVCSILPMVSTWFPPEGKQEFNNRVAGLKSYLANQRKKNPICQAKDLYKETLWSDAVNSEQLLQALEEVTYEQLQAFAQKVFETAYVKGFIGGNLTEKEAQEIWGMIKNTIQQPYPPSQHPKNYLLSIPDKKGPYKVIQKTNTTGHALLLVLATEEDTLEKQAMINILQQAMPSLYFDTVRTEQQIAYIVCSGRLVGGKRGLYYFQMQSSTHLPRDQRMRTDLFLENFLKHFSNSFSEERFQEIRRQLITSFKKEPSDIRQMCNNLSYLSFCKEGDFKREEKQIEALQKITYAQIKEYATHIFSRDNKRRFAFLIVGKSPKDKRFVYKTVDKGYLKRLKKRKNRHSNENTQG